MKKRTQKGAVLITSIIAATIGAMVVGAALEFSAKNTILVEKQIGHVKANQTLKLAWKIYKKTLDPGETYTQAQLDSIRRRIGGNSSENPRTIFGYTDNNTPSPIPGFRQHTVTWLPPITMSTETKMQPPDKPNGFWYFPGLYVANIQSVFNDSDVPVAQQRSLATLGSRENTQIIPVFNMLSFYDRDWEVAAHYESAQLIGRIHSNGSIFLDCRDSGPDRIGFHGPRDYPLISAAKYVFRRGRNGATSYYLFGNSANAGLDFYVYNDGNYEGLIDSGNYNFYSKSSIKKYDLIPDHTNSSTHDSRRFAGCVYTDDKSGIGYIFNEPDKFELDHTSDYKSHNPAQGDKYFGIMYGKDEDDELKLAVPLGLDPYQYIEDFQFHDTPDTVDYAFPLSSNLNEDHQRRDQVAGEAFSTIAPIVIRDGVAYYRTRPRGELNPVLDLLTGDSESLYPDDTHPEAKRYGDLRWYGWYGMPDTSKISPSNPARWHFPIRSVTLNVTKDALNAAHAGDGASSREGAAIPFTSRDFMGSVTTHNPLTEGAKTAAGASHTPSWISRSMDLDDVPGYPDLNATAGDSATGAGIGMWNVSYPTIDNGSIERFDPVRVAYNAVKAQVKEMYREDHRFVSRYGIGTDSENRLHMLNRDGSDPGMGNVPNVWGTSNRFEGIDYDGDGFKDYSAFWWEDGAIGHTDLTNRYWAWKISFGANKVKIKEVQFVSGGVDLPRNALSSSNNWFASAQYGVKCENFDSTANPEHAFDDVLTTFLENTIDTRTPAIYFHMPRKLPPPGSTVYYSMTPDFLILHGDKDDTDTYPKEIAIDYGVVTGTTVTEWKPYRVIDGDKISFNANGIAIIPLPRNYVYYRDQSGATLAQNGTLQLLDPGASTTMEPVELFPIQHDSMIKTSDHSNSYNTWGIYKSTLPFSSRTLVMPASRNALTGIDWDHEDSGFPLPVPLDPDRETNFGYAGFKRNIPGSAPNTFLSSSHAYYDSFWGGNANYQNWFTLLNNASEMLAKVNNNTLTFERDFKYYAGENGGYYGNDNLCMIDQQEKKIVVFTEIDLSELTEECWEFNGLRNLGGDWDNVLKNNNFTPTDSANLQNIIYAVNTSMGVNFLGKRVHCGAVRLVRGRLLNHSLSIASPNAVHVWGDYNCPGYWHHGKSDGGTSVSYHVPTRHEYSANTVQSQPAAIYADTIHAYENNWIPFDQDGTSSNSINDQYYGTIKNGRWQFNDDTDVYFDHQLWWEDDGVRRSKECNADVNGCQLFLNYHSVIFNHQDNDFYKHRSAHPDRQSNSQICKHASQGIIAALFYGNVESRVPSFFLKDDVNLISKSVGSGGYGVNRPSSIDELDWLLSWIPRKNWIEVDHENLKKIEDGTGFKPSEVDSKYINDTLKANDYLGTDFPGGSDEKQWENCKMKFGGGGFLMDIRYHTNHTHNLPEWSSGHQTYGRNIMGSFACIFDARQSFCGWDQTEQGEENQQIFYCYDPKFNEAKQLPPGTPMTSVIPKTRITLEGAKWEY